MTDLETVKSSSVTVGRAIAASADRIFRANASLDALTSYVQAGE